MEAIISSAESDGSLSEVELKRQELNDAKLLVEEATEQLKSESHVTLLLFSSSPFISPSISFLYLLYNFTPQECQTA